MADKPKLVRGTVAGVKVETTEENASRIDAFEAEAPKTARKSSSSKSSK